MGFGLAICKRIIEAHEGKIPVKSAPGKRNNFHNYPPNKTIKFKEKKAFKRALLNSVSPQL
ncbi:hypothetical protein H5T51_00405 [Candidatus Bathyarchaeota archaeon]|nr:hypothetical protein [Candidatus Bathyarchaeota archaeon]